MAYFKDYEQSRKIELQFQQHLQTQYQMLTEVTPSNEYFPYWDISSTGTTRSQGRVVKWEVKVCNTTDVFIETGQINNQELTPTALNLTTADYYTLYFPEYSNRFFIIPVKRLKELIANPDFLKNRNIYYDTNGYQLYVFKKQFIISQCKEI